MMQASGSAATAAAFWPCAHVARVWQGAVTVHTQPHLIDAVRLTNEFAETDPRMPSIVFGLLRLYFAQGPFTFDGAVLSDAVSRLDIKARINAEEMASLQPEIERFFAPGADGQLEPRPGVLLWNE